jgi:GNAT superfamily N-acetyltransferase
VNKLPEDSIFSTLKQRYDVKFEGYQLSKDSSIPPDIEMEDGVRVHHYHDHVELYRVKGEVAGIIAADYDAKNTNIDHPYEYLPHLSAIFVKKEYRGKGIASQLIHEFMESVEREKMVADVLHIQNEPGSTQSTSSTLQERGLGRKILDHIGKQEKDRQEVIETVDAQNRKVEEVIDRLISEGELFEPKAGKVKKL